MRAGPAPALSVVATPGIGVEVLEIDALPQERGDRFVTHTAFDPYALQMETR